VTATATRVRSSRLTDERIGIGAALGAAIIYGAAYPATAIGVRSFSPLGVAGLANTLGLAVVIGLVVVGVLPWRAGAGWTPDRLARLIVLAGLGGLFFLAGTNIAVSISGPTITGFVAPLYAVFATIFAVPFLGERIRPSVIVAFVLAFIGTALLAGTTPAGIPISGALIALTTAAMFGLYIVLARRWGAPYRLDGTLIAVASLIGRGPIILVFALLTDPTGVLPAAPDPAAVAAVLFIAVGSSSSGNLLLLASVRRVAAARTGGALLLTPVASAVIAAVLLGDHLTTGGFVGAALILGAMAVAAGLIRPPASVRSGPAGDRPPGRKSALAEPDPPSPTTPTSPR
jgi:drug/metabolite transporter (DMT)-like permease